MTQMCNPSQLLISLLTPVMTVIVKKAQTHEDLLRYLNFLKLEAAGFNYMENDIERHENVSHES